MNRYRIINENITKLDKNEIFVFGDNEAGIHGAGAAKFALQKCGAIMGKHDCLQGNSYGISTKDKHLNVLSLSAINLKVRKFIILTRMKSDKIFLVTKIGCGLAGYSPRDIAPMFKECLKMENVYLPLEFIIEIEGSLYSSAKIK